MSFARKWVSGMEHPQHLSFAAIMPTGRGKAGDTIAARDLFTALLPIWGRVSGAKHPATLIVRRNLAYWNEQVLNLGRGSDGDGR
jgi:hypothetical protein